ncbi:Quinoprotein glucose dehydrogenase B precursor [Arthrobacter ulcerisalmonis]|uniref:Quinoprotein glucose dehydrogenase B n=1 Tax=Arthrobacter ulcerisalmonis TaxID=2483813 RepID=A0A3P5XQX7_9MICC|nr:Quinoprotein glucose dehydrogenase B precursor [Arthrobacter ulcerisalmonis]
MSARVRFGTLLAAGVATLLVGCTVAPPAAPEVPPATVGASPNAPEVIATGLAAPWSIAFRDGTPLVSERNSGNILELDSSGASRVIGTVTGVVAAGEGGLLGLAVDGQRRVYAYSTAADGNRVQRFDVTGAPGSLALGPAETLLDRIPAAGTHNGGRIAFGPDGMLYVTTGDAGQRANAQDRSSLSGKILRMTPDGGIPADNPAPESLVYSYGHRNPQGLAWAADGTMFAAEFGQNTWDELNIITPGANYGWPTVEGIAGRDGFTDPVQQWRPADASPSGMAILAGTVFVANLRGQVLRAVPVNEPGTASTYFGGDFGRLRDAVVAPDGKLWLLTNNTDGRGAPRPNDDRIVGVALGSQ